MTCDLCGDSSPHVHEVTLTNNITGEKFKQNQCDDAGACWLRMAEQIEAAKAERRKGDASHNSQG